MRIPYSNELYHYGIRGQKWGVRRFQNPDGSLTETGKSRYARLGDPTTMGEKKLNRKTPAFEREMAKTESTHLKNVERKTNKLNKAYDEHASEKKIERLENSRRKAELGLQKIQKMADNYYSMDVDSQRKIQKGYNASKAMSAASGILFGSLGVIPAAAYTAATWKDIEKKLS